MISHKVSNLRYLDNLLMYRLHKKPVVQPRYPLATRETIIAFKVNDAVLVGMDISNDLWQHIRFEIIFWEEKVKTE